MLKTKNIRSYELKLGKRALVSLILGVSCLLFVFFIVGVHVGKVIDAHPEKFAKGIPYLVKDYFGWAKTDIDKNVASFETEKGAESSKEEKFDLTFYDALSQKGKETTLVDANPEKVAENLKPQADEKKKNNIAQAQTAQAKQEKPNPIKGKYQIQVASLKYREKAEKLSNQLVSFGYSPQIVSTELQDSGKWFRVIITGFESREKADNAVAVISGQISSVRCVVRESEGN